MLGNVPALALVSSGATQNALIDFGYAGMTSIPAQIVYNPASSYIGFVLNQVTGAAVTSSGMGCGITTPNSSLHVAGRVGTNIAYGVHAGMDASTNGNATLTLCNQPGGNGSAYINFTCPATTGSTAANNSTAYQWQIFANTNTSTGGYWALRCASGTEIFRVDNTTSARTLLIGATTTPASTTWKLHVAGTKSINTVGDVNCGGALSTQGTKNFDIPHPTKDGWRLRHRCIESPLARLHYEFTHNCSAGANTFALPDYFEALCDHSDVRVYCSPAACFAQAYGQVSGGTLTVWADTTADFHILVTSTRNDQPSKDDWQAYGVEYQQK